MVIVWYGDRDLVGKNASQEAVECDKVGKELHKRPDRELVNEFPKGVPKEGPLEGVVVFCLK